MIESVTPRFWKLLLITLTTMLVIGLSLVAILLRGAADPPRDNLTVLEFTAAGSTRAPFTLETTASGFSLMCDQSAPIFFQIRRDGYFSVTASLPDWVPFVHISRESNRLYLHVDESGHMTFRINEEIAWQGNLETVNPVCSFQRLGDH